jgi:hypothetical protein
VWDEDPKKKKKNIIGALGFVPRKAYPPIPVSIFFSNVNNHCGIQQASRSFYYGGSSCVRRSPFCFTNREFNYRFFVMKRFNENGSQTLQTVAWWKYVLPGNITTLCRDVCQRAPSMNNK